MLRTAVLLRAGVSLAFGLYFVLSTAPNRVQFFRESSYYLLLDGLVALFMAGMLLRQGKPAWLNAIVVSDGLGRLALGLWFLLVPGLQDFITTRIFILMIVCAAALALGLIGVLFALWFSWHGVLPASERGWTAQWPTLIGSAATLLFGVGFFFAWPETAGLRMLLGLYAIAVGCVALTAGIRRARQSVREATESSAEANMRTR